MKEATGELSNAVVVIICVAILIAFFSFEVWPIIRGQFKAQISCDKAICENTDPDGDGRVNCRLKDDPDTTFTCPYKG